MNRTNQNIQHKHLRSPLSESERVEACCLIAREKLEIGDYDAGTAALQSWWTMDEWPNHSELTTPAAAQLLLTAGMLSSAIASTKRLEGRQKPAEALLSGAVALFEQVGEKTRAAEGRIELACCYFWQGLFDLARLTLESTLNTITEQSKELKSAALFRLALVEHHSGRLQNAYTLLSEALPIVQYER